jgi:hypothetical protein
MATPIEIPKVLIKKFMEHPRLVFNVAAPGYWPVSLEYLKGNELFDKLFKDKEFAETHQVVIMKR